MVFNNMWSFFEATEILYFSNAILNFNNSEIWLRYISTFPGKLLNNISCKKYVVPLRKISIFLRIKKDEVYSSSYDNSVARRADREIWRPLPESTSNICNVGYHIVTLPRVGTPFDIAILLLYTIVVVGRAFVHDDKKRWDKNENLPQYINIIFLK